MGRLAPVLRQHIEQRFVFPLAPRQYCACISTVIWLCSVHLERRLNNPVLQNGGKSAGFCKALTPSVQLRRFILVRPGCDGTDSATRHAISFAALHSSSTATTQRWTTPPTTDHHPGQANTRADRCIAISPSLGSCSTSHLTWVPVPRRRQASLRSCCIVRLPATASIGLGVTFQSDANASGRQPRDYRGQY